ncbi:MAG: hypothetical protein ACO1SV_17635 [Fimbriimonas sp.]
MVLLDSPFLDLQQTPEPFDPKAKPALFVDGRRYMAKELPDRVHGKAAFVIGATDPYLQRLGMALGAEYLYLYEFKGEDLTALGEISGLRHLKIQWAPKFTSLESIRALHHLETLFLTDTPKLRDLEPVAGLERLRAFEYSGGFVRGVVAETLEPLTRLPRLEELRMVHLKVERDGLRPLARCSTLRDLELSNQFDMEDYALLSVALPGTACDAFTPWEAFDVGDGRDRMMRGKGKGFLNSTTQAARIERHEQAFAALQEKHRRLLTP